MRVMKGISVILGLCLMGGASVAFGVTSTFDTDAEGWVSYDNGGGAANWISSGGNPGGYIQMDDVGGGWGYFQAPSSFLSQPLLYGGTISFDLKHFGGASFNVRVGLVGAGLTLINESVLPTTEWATYSFTMDEVTGWRKFSSLSQNYSAAAPAATLEEVQAVLANPTGLFIAADYNNFSTTGLDVTSLDNVSVDAVPEPMTLAVLGLGALVARRRRKSA